MPLPRPCHFVSQANEVFLRKLLCGSGMAKLTEGQEVPRTRGGRNLLAGLFTVPHKVTSDRLIVDRRAQNETEKRLGWAELPHGTTLCQIRLAPKDHLRASSFDLST